LCGICWGGASEKEAAAELFISVNTVHDHVKKVYEKLNVHDRTSLHLRVLNAAQDDGS